MNDKIVDNPIKMRNERIFELVEQGLTYEEIGDLVGLSRQRISQICLKNGIVRRPHDVNPNLWKKHWEKNRKKTYKIVIPNE